MTEDEASEISTMLRSMAAQLDRWIQATRERDADDFNKYARGIGSILGAILKGMLEPLYAEHPEICPPGFSQAKSKTQAEPSHAWNRASDAQSKHPVDSDLLDLAHDSLEQDKALLRRLEAALSEKRWNDIAKRLQMHDEYTNSAWEACQDFISLGGVANEGRQFFDNALEHQSVRNPAISIAWTAPQTDAP